VPRAAETLPRHAPEYEAQLRRVWLWDDWPDRPFQDLGIDLIAETRGGNFWAIQAKTYALDYSVTKRDLDSFLAASASRRFSYRLLVAPRNATPGGAGTEKWHPNVDTRSTGRTSTCEPEVVVRRGASFVQFVSEPEFARGRPVGDEDREGRLDPGRVRNPGELLPAGRPVVKDVAALRDGDDGAEAVRGRYRGLGK
jgi:hypothetical protein